MNDSTNPSPHKQQFIKHILKSGVDEAVAESLWTQYEAAVSDKYNPAVGDILVKYIKTLDDLCEQIRQQPKESLAALKEQMEALAQARSEQFGHAKFTKKENLHLPTPSQPQTPTTPTATKG